MIIFLGILLAIVVFTFVVFIHELGHFVTAKMSGVRVYEFGIGIPPRAFTLFTDKSGTKYTINWIPLGGFVRLHGEDMDDGLYDHESLIHKPLWNKMIVILAGVAMNFLLAGIIFSIAFWVGVKPLAINSKLPTNIETKLIPTIEQAVEKKMLLVDGIELSPLIGGPASQAGMKDRDRLITIDGLIMKSPESMVQYIASSKESIRFEVLRDDKKVAFTVTPKEGKIGTYVGYHIVSNDDNFKYQYSFPEAIKEGFKEMFSQSRLTFSFLGDLVKKLVAPKNAGERKEATESLSGPVGVGSMFVGLVSANVTASVIFLVMAVISINLGVFNLLPFPALDGGRFFFMALDAFFVRFFGKKSSHGRIEHIAHLVGFVILIGLSIFVAYQDIARLFQ